jgi:hypothetical protein
MVRLRQGLTRFRVSLFKEYKPFPLTRHLGQLIILVLLAA